MTNGSSFTESTSDFLIYSRVVATATCSPILNITSCTLYCIVLIFVPQFSTIHVSPFQAAADVTEELLSLAVTMWEGLLPLPSTTLTTASSPELSWPDDALWAVIKLHSRTLAGFGHLCIDEGNPWKGKWKNQKINTPGNHPRGAIFPTVD